MQAVPQMGLYNNENDTSGARPQKKVRTDPHHTVLRFSDPYVRMQLKLLLATHPQDEDVNIGDFVTTHHHHHHRMHQSNGPQQNIDQNPWLDPANNDMPVCSSNQGDQHHRGQSYGNVAQDNRSQEMDHLAPSTTNSSSHERSHLNGISQQLSSDAHRSILPRNTAPLVNNDDQENQIAGIGATNKDQEHPSISNETPRPDPSILINVQDTIEVEPAESATLNTSMTADRAASMVDIPPTTTIYHDELSPEPQSAGSSATQHSIDTQETELPEITVNFIVPLSGGDPNLEDPIPFATFVSADLPRLYRLINQRRDIPVARENIRRLAFSLRWGSQRLYKIERDCTDSEWKNLQEVISDSFEFFKFNVEMQDVIARNQRELKIFIAIVL
jgi:hypothetical protein